MLKAFFKSLWKLIKWAVRNPRKFIVIFLVILMALALAMKRVGEVLGGREEKKVSAVLAEKVVALEKELDAAKKAPVKAGVKSVSEPAIAETTPTPKVVTTPSIEVVHSTSPSNTVIASETVEGDQNTTQLPRIDMPGRWAEWRKDIMMFLDHRNGELFTTPPTFRMRDSESGRMMYPFMDFALRDPKVAEIILRKFGYGDFRVEEYMEAAQRSKPQSMW